MNPFIMLTAKGEEIESICGLEIGADDYVIKPFSPNELIAQVKAVLRHTNPEKSLEFIIFQDILINLEKFQVSKAGVNIHLESTEFGLLRV